MSFRQGARQFFEQRAAPPPPLPYDYAVEYIETDGVASYVDTGVPVDGSDTMFVFNFAFVGNVASDGEANNPLYYLQSGWYAMGCFAPRTIYPSTSYSFDTTGEVFYDCEVSNLSNGGRIAKVNGDVIATAATKISLILTGINYPIGARFGAKGLVSTGHVKCATFQIFDGNGNCKFNGIPVVANGVAGMYDSISWTVKTNAAATGKITAGPRV